MSLVLALELDSRLRRRLLVGVRAGAAHGLVDRVHFASGWSDLVSLALRHPDSPAFVDPSYPSQRRHRDPMASLQRKVPRCPLVGYGKPIADRTGSVVDNVGLVARLTPGVDDSFVAIATTVLKAADHRSVRALARQFKRAAPAAAAATMLDRVVRDTVFPCTVGALAANLGTSATMLRRRCRAWGMPNPKKLLSLARIYHVQRLAGWSGRPAGAVALALRFSGYANYARSVQRELACTSTQVGKRGGAAYVAEQLIAAINTP